MSTQSSEIREAQAKQLLEELNKKTDGVSGDVVSLLGRLQSLYQKDNCDRVWLLYHIIEMVGKILQHDRSIPGSIRDELTAQIEALQEQYDEELLPRAVALNELTKKSTY